MKFIHKRKEGDQIWEGINLMSESSYTGIYFRFGAKVLKVRVRTKEYCEATGLKRIGIFYVYNYYATNN